jgi:hypothetical protein
MYSKIYCDYETKMEATVNIDFTYIEHIEFANKLINFPIFEPIDPINDWWDFNYQKKEPMYALKIIRTHSNPFLLDFENKC